MNRTADEDFGPCQQNSELAVHLKKHAVQVTGMKCVVQALYKVHRINNNHWRRENEGLFPIRSLSRRAAQNLMYLPM